MPKSKNVLLLVDTTVPSRLVVGVASRSKLIAHKTKRITFHGGETLLPFLKNFLTQQDITPSDLEHIVVAKGPGSFTAVRIGVVTAAALSYALSIPVTGVVLPQCKESLSPKELQQRLDMLLVKGLRLKSGTYKNLRVKYTKSPNITKPKQRI